jgi:hypothetical protein
MKEKGRLILTPEIINQIMYLHATVGKTEWSGILLYDVISGNPSKPSEFVLEAKNIFLMDIGTGAATEYDFDGDIVDIYDNIEGSMEMKIGHVHSHHDMNTFFSGTDINELMTNVGKHNYYVSLIVNFSGNYSCKVAFLSEVESTTWMHYVNDHGELKKFKQNYSQKHMVVIDMSIIMGYQDEFFYKRISQIQQKIEDAKKIRQLKSNKLGQKSLTFKGSENSNVKYYSEHNTPDPRNLTNGEIEHLTRNILALNTDLNEERSVYTMLHFLAEKTTEDEIDLYCDYLESNIELIISEFFDNKVLTDKEEEIVIEEVCLSINRFGSIKAVKILVEKVIETIEFYLESKKDENFDAINETAALDKELKDLVG